MPKKRKKSSKKRRPPPRPPAGRGTAGSAPSRSESATPAASEAAGADTGSQERGSQAKSRREAQRERRRKAERRRRMKMYAIASLVVLVIVSLFAWRAYNNRRASQELAQLASAAGCSEIEEYSPGEGDRAHLDPGASYPDYETSPPTFGPHWTGALPAGVYDEPFTATVPATAQQTGAPSITQAIHSLEHGYVTLWHNELELAELDRLIDRFEREEKVIVVPYPDLESGSKLALTAWARKQTCPAITDEVIEVADRFVERFREARSAPEPLAP